MRHAWMAIALALAMAVTAGCSRELVGGAAIGAGGAGAAYEYSNKKQMDDLREELEAGKISRDEYERRKGEIENRSLIY